LNKNIFNFDFLPSQAKKIPQRAGDTNVEDEVLTFIAL
jgi:hypothetical protein